MTEAAAAMLPNPLAVVNGQALMEMPPGLYIPPDALAVYLTAFEGPLDLLLYLIRRHHLDVLDIPMAELTRQYMEYVTLMRRQKLEMAAEYMLMAVWLIEIKSRMLLPRVASADEADEDGDPRASLVRRLLDYEQMRLAAQKLDDLPRSGRDFVVAWIAGEPAEKMLPGLTTADLQLAWRELASRVVPPSRHAVARRELSVRAAMEQILQSLQGDLFVEFDALFVAEQGLSHRVVRLLAILELAREQRLELVQNQVFSPIYIRLAQAAVPDHG